MCVDLHQCRAAAAASQEQMPQCIVFRVETITKKGPASLKGLVKFSASSHLAICIRKLLVHFEFKVPINVVGRAKNLQK